MKKKILILFIALIILFAGCDAFIAPETEAPVTGNNVTGAVKTGVVSVSFSEEGRTILPDLYGYYYGRHKIVLLAESLEGEDDVQVEYEYEYYQNSNNSYYHGYNEIELIWGDWNITATWYIGEYNGYNYDYYAVASGSAPITVASFSQSLYIYLNMPQEGGQGWFEYTIYKDNSSSVLIILEAWPSEGNVVFWDDNNSSSYFYDTRVVDSGMYFIRIMCTTPTGLTYEYNDIVHIYDKQTTVINKSFYEESYPRYYYRQEYNPYIYLTSDVNYYIVDLPLEGRNNVLKAQLGESNWAAAFIDFGEILGKSYELACGYIVKFKFTADIKVVGRTSVNEDLFWHINNDDYPTINNGGSITMEENNWYRFYGEWNSDDEIPLYDSYPKFFLPHRAGNGAIYYIDNFDIWDFEILFNPHFPPTDCTALTFNKWEESYMPYDGEKWFSFVADSNPQYIHVNPGDLYYCYIELYDELENYIDRIYFSYTNYTTFYYLTEGDTYYIKVYPYWYNYYGDFRIAYNSSSTPPFETANLEIWVYFHTAEEQLGVYDISSGLTFNVSNSTNFVSFEWILDGEARAETTYYLVLNDYDLDVGPHRLTVIATTSGGVPYSQEFIFRVE